MFIICLNYLFHVWYIPPPFLCLLYPTHYSFITLVWVSIWWRVISAGVVSRMSSSNITRSLIRIINVYFFIFFINHRLKFIIFFMIFFVLLLINLLLFLLRNLFLIYQRFYDFYLSLNIVIICLILRFFLIF